MWRTDAWGLGSGTPSWGPVQRTLVQPPWTSPVLSKATQALPIHKTAKASSLGVHGWQAEVGTTGKEREKRSFIPGLKLIKGRVQHTKSFSDCRDKKIK